MPHSWKAFDIAKDITDALVRSKIIEDKEFIQLKTRGIIQIIIEDRT